MTWNMNLWWALGWWCCEQKISYFNHNNIYIFDWKNHEKWLGHSCHPSFIDIVRRKCLGTRMINAEKTYTNDEGNEYKIWMKENEKRFLEHMISTSYLMTTKWITRMIFQPFVLLLADSCSYHTYHQPWVLSYKPRAMRNDDN